MKRFVLIYMVALIIMVSFSVTSSAFEIVLPDYEFEDEIYDLGDIDGNGEVNSVDLGNLSRYLAGGEIKIVGDGDITGDGYVMSNDLAALRRYFSGGQI